MKRKLMVILVSVMMVFALVPTTYASVVTDHNSQIPETEIYQYEEIDEEESEELEASAGIIEIQRIQDIKVSFKKTGTTKAHADISLSGSGKTTKLILKVSLQKKVDGTYKTVSGTTTEKTANSRSISFSKNYNVTKTGSYRLKFTVTEYVGANKSSKNGYKSLDHNGY